MIRWAKVRPIASFEFLSTVKRKGYLIATFGMPLFVLLYGGIISLIGVLSTETGSLTRTYGVVDLAGVLALERETEQPMPRDRAREVLERFDGGELGSVDVGFPSGFVFRPYDDEEAARADLAAGEIEGFFVIREDYLDSGAVDSWAREDVDLQGSESRAALGNLLLERLLEGRVPAEIAARALVPIDRRASREWTLTAEGVAEEREVFAVLARLLVPVGFTVLLFVSLMMSAGYLLQATVIEKENKVVEILLSSAGPDEILAGKLLGLGAAGLLQIVLWFGMVVFGLLVSMTALGLAGVVVPWAGLAAATVYFLGGYLFFGSLMLGTGSLGSNLKESQQLSMVWTALAIVPMLCLQILITEPNGTLGRVLTWIPFTAPVTAVLRLTLDPGGVTWWEVLGSLLVLLGSLWLVVRFGARLFRVGLLLSGARPKLREILRQARLSS
jgi:ABC-2 type transport system permease protein